MTDFDFRDIDLEPRDKLVYETLYRLDRSSLRVIAKTTNLNRGTVYEIIKKLLKIGLVTFTQTGARRYYTAAPPDALVSFLRDRREQLRHTEAAAVDYAAQLASRRDIPGTDGYFASFYEGDEGVAAILRDVLQSTQGLDRKEYYAISSRHLSTFLYNNFKSFSRQRAQSDIFVRVISDAPPREKLVLAERRQLPASGETLNGYTLIYGDKTALLSIDDANVLSAIVITDPGVANMQRLIFDQLWQSLPAD